MSTTNRTGRVGTEDRTDAAGRKQYRGYVYDRRAKRKLRGDWSYSLAAAKAWRTDALAKLDAGLLSADRGDTITVAASAFIAAAKSGEARTRSGGRYKPSAIRNYEQGFRLRMIPAIGASRLADVRTAELQRKVHLSAGGPAEARSRIRGAGFGGADRGGNRRWRRSLRSRSVRLTMS
jgi:hypothetical protein